MSIELTNEQRQALQAERGEPVNVVDPATSQRYVLIAREQYEHIRSLLEQPEQPHPTAVSQPPQGPSPGAPDLAGLYYPQIFQGEGACPRAGQRYD